MNKIIFLHGYVCLMICATIVWMVTAAANIVELNSLGFKQQFRDGTRIKHYSNSGVFFCGMECIRTTDCIDVNYSPYIRQCQTLKQDSVMTMKGHVHWLNIRNMAFVQTTSKCKDKPCGPRQYCLDDEQNPGYYCVFIECDIPEEMTNMTLTYGRRLIFDYATYTCISPYYPFGNPKVKCLPTGEWSKLLMKCTICDEVPEIPLAVPNKQDRTVGTKVKYSCVSPELHNAVGKDTITCNTNGKWTSSDFSCVDGWGCYNYTSVDTGNMQTNSEQKVCEEMGSGTKKFTNGSDDLAPGCNKCSCCIRL